MDEAVSVLYGFSLNRSKHAHARRTRRVISAVMSAVSSIAPPWYKTATTAVCLCLWPAASVTSSEERVVWFGVRSSMASVFLSDTVRPAASKKFTIAVIIFDGLPLTWRQCLHRRRRSYPILSFAHDLMAQDFPHPVVIQMNQISTQCVALHGSVQLLL